MPQISGMQLSQELRRIRSDFPNILSTGSSEMLSPDKFQAIGINELLMKPIIMRNLAEIVRQVLG
jgi:CheY-like chemotaxis protein